MKKEITEWLEDDNREFEVKDQSGLNWLIHLKHGNRVVLLGNPEQNDKRLEVVYKLNVSEEHKKVLKKLNNKQRSGFEKKLVMILAQDTNIYNIQRDDQELPEAVIVKQHLYDDDLKKTLLFDTIQNVINIGMRATIHFQSLGGAEMEEQEVSSTKSGPSIYR
ncbi:MAG: DUF2299 family protein [Candidatus Thermoplasmatota archaeon]|nr:DUF2299 family protein [Candidatus Thermoplasmatota archaeon]